MHLKLVSVAITLVLVTILLVYHTFYSSFHELVLLSTQKQTSNRIITILDDEFNTTNMDVSNTSNLDGLNTIKTINLDGFNKTIFILWYDGFENAPTVVKWCLHSWKHYNPTWNIVELDNSNLNNYISASQIQKEMPNRATMMPNHVSDVIRMILLDQYGGVWTDATVFCNRPLDDWIYGNITQGFFAFARPSPERMLSTWFLYGSRNNHIIHTWLNATVSYFIANPVTDVYFVPHILFGSLYEQDPKFKAIWGKVNYVPVNDGPDLLAQRGFYNPLSQEVRHGIDTKMFPLFKLSWKLITVEQNITNYQYLLTTLGKVSVY